MESTASSSDLEAVLMELQGLKEFIDKNSQFSPTSLGAARLGACVSEYVSSHSARVYVSGYRDADSSALAVSALLPTCSKGYWDSCVQTAPALSKSSKSSRGNTIVRLSLFIYLFILKRV